VELMIDVDDPTSADLCTVIEGHLAFARRVTNPGHVHALGVEGLTDPSVTFFSARLGGSPAGIGALKELDQTHGELKSMHTLATARRQGIGRAMVVHMLGVARQRGYLRVSLETGTYEAFEPARTLYHSLGFRKCPPFGDYTDNPYSVCMTVALVADHAGPPQC
jgi:putative acetyltransferase